MKAQSLEKMQKLQAEARNRILKRGKIEFRADPAMLSSILNLAVKRKMAVGPMIRQWVKECVEREAGATAPSQLDNIEQKLDQLLFTRKKPKAK